MFHPGAPFVLQKDGTYTCTYEYLTYHVDSIWSTSNSPQKTLRITVGPANEKYHEDHAIFLVDCSPFFTTVSYPGKNYKSFEVFKGWEGPLRYMLEQCKTYASAWTRQPRKRLGADANAPAPPAAAAVKRDAPDGDDASAKKVKTELKA